MRLWRKKADLNLKKHNVTFEEATSVFDDPLSKIIDDSSNSFLESREKITGYSKNERLLFVSFTERKNQLRIISEREATKNGNYTAKTTPPFIPPLLGEGIFSP